MTLAPAALDEDFVRAAAAAPPRRKRCGPRSAPSPPTPDPTDRCSCAGCPSASMPATPPRPGVPTGKDRTSERHLARLSPAPSVSRSATSRNTVADWCKTSCPIARAATARSRRRRQSRSRGTPKPHSIPHKPRYLLLLCLRGDPQAVTMLCSIERVLPHLDAGHDRDLACAALSDPAGRLVSRRPRARRTRTARSPCSPARRRGRRSRSTKTS